MNLRSATSNKSYALPISEDLYPRSDKYGNKVRSEQVNYTTKVYCVK